MTAEKLWSSQHRLIEDNRCKSHILQSKPVACLLSIINLLLVADSINLSFFTFLFSCYSCLVLFSSLFFTFVIIITVSVLFQITSDYHFIKLNVFNFCASTEYVSGHLHTLIIILLILIICYPFDFNKNVLIPPKFELKL